MKELVEQIAQHIRERAGGRVTIDNHLALPAYALNWTYDCPCGELSGYRVAIPERSALAKIDPDHFVKHYVETALSAMRRHVRSEGNEPSF